MLAVLPLLEDDEPDEDELDDDEDWEPCRLEGMLAVLPWLGLLAPGIDGIEDWLDDWDPGIEGIDAWLELDEEELDDEELWRDEDDELLGIGGELEGDPDEEAVGIDDDELLEELCCSSQPASNRPIVSASANGRHGREPEVSGASMAAVSLFAAVIGDQY